MLSTLGTYIPNRYSHSSLCLILWSPNSITNPTFITQNWAWWIQKNYCHLGAHDLFRRNLSRVREPVWRWEEAKQEWAQIKAHLGLITEDWHANCVFHLYFEGRGWSFCSPVSISPWPPQLKRLLSQGRVCREGHRYSLQLFHSQEGVFGLTPGEGALGKASMPSMNIHKGKCQRVISARRQWTFSNMRETMQWL